MMPVKHTLKDRNLWLLMGVFLCVQIVLYIKTGMVTSLEAEKYIREGTELSASGHLTETRFIFYLPVILLVAFCKLLGISLQFVVLAQVLLSALAVYCFYRMAVQLTTPLWGLGISILLAVCIPVQEWNMYLYSDSLFISLSVIFFSILYSCSIKKEFNWIALLLVPVIWCFSRPAGMLFVIPLFVLAFASSKKNRWLVLGGLIAVLGIIFAATAYFNGGGDLDTLKPYIEEHIICFVPQNETGAKLNIVHTGNQLNDLFYYILHNPGHFISLLAQRVASFFNLTRPWYSSMHNMLMIVLMLPVYIFFIPGLTRLFKTNRPFAWFVLSALIIYPIGVVMQCDDWHNRFTMPLLPLMMLVAAYGLFSLVNKRKTAG